MASRREFLKEAGGLLIGFSLADAAIAPQLFGAETVTAPSPAKLDAWLRVEKNETIQVLTGKVDIGMGVSTALRQIIAEELDISPDRVTLVLGDTAQTPDQGGVGGSTSISAGARPLRNAAASARYALLHLASEKLGTPVDQLTVKDGVISAKSDASKSISYGTLAGGIALNDNLKVSGAGFGLNVEGLGKPKDPASYTVVGQSIPRADLRPKILGQATYATDVRVPGMVHARVIRPASAGAKLVSMDDAAAKKIPGYVKTIVKGDFVGVVAEREWAATRAAKALKVTWSAPASLLPADLYNHMRATTPKVSRPGLTRGDVVQSLAGAAHKIEASYEWPFQAHATMGPGCAVAQYSADGVTTVWCGAQKPHALQKGLAGILQVPLERVRVIWVEDAGSYGRAGYEDVAADAAILSQAVGKPVRVQWTREDMTAWGGKGPATTFDLAAAFDSAGIVTGLDFTSRAFSGTEISPPPEDPGNMLAAQLMGIPNKSGGNEFSQLGDTTIAYNFANIRSTSHIVPAFLESASPMRATHLRDPGGPAGSFAGESFMDELAAVANTDPVAFRLRYITDPRAKAALTAVAERVKWDTRPSPKPANGTGDVATGRGVALSNRGGTIVATVAEVDVNRSTGDVKVKRLTCAHDCGLIVNPEALRGTIAANLIQSMSRTLKEEVTFDRNNVTSTDWTGYRVARASDIPEIEIILINHPELPPGGAGEPSSRPTAAAIGNAIFDATGIRLRQVPLTPARVKSQMKTA